MYGLIVSCRLNGIVPECYLSHVLSMIAKRRDNCICELLPWHVTLPEE
ncbi:transposase domain-containing protein [Pantoea sp. Acro-835]|uniref:Transposase domain-containing protein n=1 Tax=Candidatus Pantoea multigeneris TaxID=2608357 RepID=A0ABX0RKP9_9GAMM|nr:transposase domain-containing protein [Pantoea multigeneris]